MERNAGENYISFLKRVIEMKSAKAITYREMGDSLVEDNKWSPDNWRKFYYCIKPILDKIDEDIDIDKVQELKEVKRQLEIMKIQYQDERRVNAKYMRPMARHERMLDTLKEQLEKWKPLEVKHYNTPNDFNRQASLLISDTHFGIECDNYWNKFNLKIGEERLSKVFGSAKSYCKTFKVKTLHIELLGDLISGIIHKTIELENEVDVIKQVIFAADLLSKYINEIANSEIEIVNVYMTVGNHGRVNPNKKESVDKENFEYLIWDGIKARVKHPKVHFIENEIDETFINYQINGKMVIGVHGQYDRVNSIINDFAKMFQCPIHSIHMGHLHHAYSDEDSNIKLYMNSTLSGVDIHSKNLRLIGNPSQTLLVYDGDNTININIGL